ncbi:hypothetical protein OAL25_00065 [bacterium]|nr:hypothetical protein [bacterium]
MTVFGWALLIVILEDHKGQQVEVVFKVLLVLLAKLAPQVFKEQLVYKVFRVRKVQLVDKVLKDRKGLRVHKELLAELVLKVLKVRPGDKAHKVGRVHKGRKVDRVIIQ